MAHPAAAQGAAGVRLAMIRNAIRFGRLMLNLSDCGTRVTSPERPVTDFDFLGMGAPWVDFEPVLLQPMHQTVNQDVLRRKALGRHPVVSPTSRPEGVPPGSSSPAAVHGVQHPFCQFGRVDVPVTANFRHDP